MVFSAKISAERKARVKVLKELTSLSVSEIARKCNISRSSIYRMLKQTTNRKKTKSSGRPRKISGKDERHMARTLIQLRKAEGTVSCSRVMSESGIDLSKISVWTARRALNRLGYYHLVARKKGLLSAKDLVLRSRFAKQMARTKPDSFWTRDVCFYLDGVSFVHKYNPCSESCAPGCRVWRKKKEGLTAGCTSKGTHMGSGGRTVQFFVAISYGVGMVFCHQYEHLNGDHFKNIILNHFNDIFRLCNRPNSRIFIQDGDPSQNSAVARKALNRIGTELFSHSTTQSY